MTDKYTGKPVLKHLYCEHEYKNQKVHQQGSKVKKNVFKAGIEPRMVNSLQFKELCVQNTTGVYPWLGKYVIQLFTVFTNKSTY